LRSSRRIRLRPNPLWISNVSAKPKNSNFNPVTDGYTKALAPINSKLNKNESYSRKK